MLHDHAMDSCTQNAGGCVVSAGGVNNTLSYSKTVAGCLRPQEGLNRCNDSGHQEARQGFHIHSPWLAPKAPTRGMKGFTNHRTPAGFNIEHLRRSCIGDTRYPPALPGAIDIKRLRRFKNG